MWHLGLCSACTKRSFSNKYGKAALYLNHVSDVVHYIKDNYPNLKIIIWDDMIRNMDIEILKGKYIQGSPRASADTFLKLTTKVFFMQKNVGDINC